MILPVSKALTFGYAVHSCVYEGTFERPRLGHMGHMCTCNFLNGSIFWIFTVINVDAAPGNKIVHFLKRRASPESMNQLKDFHIHASVPVRTQE